MANDGLKVGINIDIQRTDGRVHSAVVSGINFETSSVAVEWFEHGETKGKEIELEAVYNLNPDLLPVFEPPPAKNVLEPKGYDDDVDDEIGDDYDSDQFDQPSDYTDEEPEAPYRHQVRNVMARQIDYFSLERAQFSEICISFQ